MVFFFSCLYVIVSEIKRRRGLNDEFAPNFRRKLDCVGLSLNTFEVQKMEMSCVLQKWGMGDILFAQNALDCLIELHVSGLVVTGEKKMAFVLYWERLERRGGSSPRFLFRCFEFWVFLFFILFLIIFYCNKWCSSSLDMTNFYGSRKNRIMW